MRFIAPFVLAAVVGFLSVSPASAAELTRESLGEIKVQVAKEKGVLVDVREKREWQQGHVKGAIFLPLSSLQDGVTQAELKPLPKDKVLYLHCVVGKRAVTAGKVLEKYGYEVRPIKPGYREMISAGFPQAKE